MNIHLDIQHLYFYFRVKSTYISVQSYGYHICPQFHDVSYALIVYMTANHPYIQSILDARISVRPFSFVRNALVKDLYPQKTKLRK